MITLNVESYCQECPEFEPQVTMMLAGELAAFTVVKCKRAAICELIAQHLAERAKERGEGKS